MTFRIKKTGISMAMSALITILAISCQPQDRYIIISGFAQGGVYTVKLNLNGQDGMIDAKPEEIKDSIDHILSGIEASLSGYNRNSLLSRFNDGETIRPDTYFTDMYTQAYRFYETTGGAVDVAAGPIFDLWGFGFKSGSVPEDGQIDQAKLTSGMKRLCKDIHAVIAESNGNLCSRDIIETSVTDDALPQLNFNAIAQGYSCDVVASYLYSLGVKDMMVDIGEIFCDGKNPSGGQWSLGIDRPKDGNDTPGADLQGIFKVPEGPHGIVTSGNYRKFYISEGRKYAHTIDPRTGRPVTHNLLSATIVAADAMTADAYATYCMVIGFEDARNFISSSEELEGCLVYDENGIFKTWCSEGFLLEDINADL